MFVGREKELATLKEQLSSSTKTAVLIYGKRRVGKSTLIAQAIQDFSGVVINHLCVQSTYEGNLELLYRSVSRALSLPNLSFPHVFDLFEFLGQQNKDILVVLDEYQYFKQSLKNGEMDSYLQTIIDTLPPNVKIILCGSYISIMKELLDEENPLFGRMSAIMHVKDFDYYDAARFYPKLPPYQKIALYGVFGGSPFVLESLDLELSLQENVERLLLPATGILRTHIESVMLKEIQKSFDVRILEVLGNGKKRYSDILGLLGGQNNGLLDKQLKSLMDMETITKTYPINKAEDKKKHFYEIEDNLMRTYFAFLFGRAPLVDRLGEHTFFENEIAPTLTQYISRRYEEVVRQYFVRLAHAGKLPGVDDFGTYWYDDPTTKTNGEFDCVLKRGDTLDFFECKYRKAPMEKGECEAEERQVRSIPNVDIGLVGFACTGGFSFKSKAYKLITGDKLYKLTF